LKAFHQAGFVHTTATDVKLIISAFNSLYTRVPEWHKELMQEAITSGYLTDGWGRRRYFSDPYANFNEIVNYKVQASGAGMQWDNILLVEALAKRCGGHIAIPMHDELVSDVPDVAVNEFAANLITIMEREFPQVTPGFHCPIEVKVGKRWRVRKGNVWKRALESTHAT